VARLAELKRVGLDTVVFIYALENHPVFGKPSLALFEAAESGHMSATACDLVLAELIVQPLKLNRNDVVERYFTTLPTFPNLSFRPVSRQVVVEAVGVPALAAAYHNGFVQSPAPSGYQ
jgi:predicted nucleic acid-binding protein